MTSTPNDVPPWVTEDDRDAAVRRVQEAFTEGHLSQDEMEERLHTVLTARTRGELVPALASLPDTDTGPTSVVAVKSGRIQRRGAWRVPRVLRIESEYGKVHLDLSRAIIEHPVVDIELQLRYGRANITVPRDAVVDVQGLRTDWKQPVHKLPRRAQRDGPRIRITGVMDYGRLKVRHRRR